MKLCLVLRRDDGEAGHVQRLSCLFRFDMCDLLNRLGPIWHLTADQRNPGRGFGDEARLALRIHAVAENHDVGAIHLEEGWEELHLDSHCRALLGLTGK